MQQILLEHSLYINKFEESISLVELIRGILVLWSAGLKNSG